MNCVILSNWINDATWARLKFSPNLSLLSQRFCGSTEMLSPGRDRPTGFWSGGTQTQAQWGGTGPNSKGPYFALFLDNYVFLLFVWEWSWGKSLQIRWRMLGDVVGHWHSKWHQARATVDGWTGQASTRLKGLKPQMHSHPGGKGEQTDLIACVAEPSAWRNASSNLVAFVCEHRSETRHSPPNMNDKRRDKIWLNSHQVEFELHNLKKKTNKQKQKQKTKQKQRIPQIKKNHTHTHTNSELTSVGKSNKFAMFFCCFFSSSPQTHFHRQMTQSAEEIFGLARCDGDWQDFSSWIWQWQGTLPCALKKGAKKASGWNMCGENGYGTSWNLSLLELCPNFVYI